MGLTKARSGQDNYPPLGKFASQWNFIYLLALNPIVKSLKKNTLKIKRNNYFFYLLNVLLITAIATSKSAKAKPEVVWGLRSYPC